MGGLRGRFDQQMGPPPVVGFAEVESVGDPRPGQSEIALRGRGHRPQNMTEGLGPHRLDPPGNRPRQVGLAVLAGSERDKALTELAAVEAVPAPLDDGPERTGCAGAPHHRSGPQTDRDVGVALHPGHLRRAVGQQGRGREPVVSYPDGLGQHISQRQPPVASMQGQPTVHRAGHSHRGDIAVQRHLVAALFTEPVGVSARPGESGAVERHWRAAAPVVHQRPHVATGPAHVGRRHGQHRVGAYRRVRGRPALPQQVHPHTGGHVIDS